MKTRVLTAALSLLAVTAAGARPAAAVNGETPAASIESLAWLAGHWGSSRTGADTEELWLAPKGGLMLGLHREARGSEAFFEYLRIEQTDDGVVYVASPSGSGATAFRMTLSEKGRVVFENPEHDFPQRLSYELDDDGALLVRAEAETEGGERRALSWRWERLDATSAASTGTGP